jgi:hypothetical protein
MKNIFRRNTSIQNTNSIIKPLPIEMIRGREFETQNDAMLSGRVVPNYAEIYSPIMNES